MLLELIQPLIDWVTRNPELSGLFIFLIAFGESLALVGIVVPGVVFMLSIGTLVGLGAINIWSALIWAALGAIAGDWLSYWLGRHFDQQLRHLWPLSRYPKLIPAGEKFFKRHGGKSVLFGRFVGPLRPIIPAVAGIMHMSQAKFYFMNIVSAILWAPVVIMPGVAFGSSLQLAQEVFDKLIILVVIAVLVSALFGYIAKKLFAYALMTTVNTWGELFGFDRARENLTSFSLVSVLILLVAFFVAQYDQRYQAIATEQQATDQQWWQNNWQLFSPASDDASQFRSNFPVTVQWWGDLQNIQAKMKQLQWQTAESLTFKNGLVYFLSEPEPLKLPAKKSKLFNSVEQLIMVKQKEKENQLLVFRLWSASARPAHPGNQLWLGVIYSVDLVSPFNLVNIPLRNEDFAESIKLFNNEISDEDGLVVNKKLYSRVDRFKFWQGEVLLLRFDESDEVNALQTPQHRLREYSLPGKNISLVIPGSFSGSPEDGFSYQDNGVTLSIKRLEGEEAGHLDEIRTSIRRQLENPGDLQHAPLISLEEKNLFEPTMQGSRFVALYDMPFLGKQLFYRVKIMQKDSETWIATATHKQCDERGEQAIQSMLNDITFRTIN